MEQGENSGTQNGKACVFHRDSFTSPHQQRYFHKTVSIVFLTILTVGLAGSAFGQGEPVPFEVSNPKHKEWPAEEAGKIYYSACELLARTIRPEKPPSLRPKFLLVLGTNKNQVVRTDRTVEVHLKSWDADRFAEAIVLVAAREVLRMEDLTKIARQSVASAQSTVSVVHLSENR